jgi:betaine-aldehyde dehydrogenase
MMVTPQLAESVDGVEDSRRRQLIEVTIDSLAEVGFVGTTLAQVAARASVSPGLVAHYFGDKDNLLAETFRSLARRTARQIRVHLRRVATPRGKIQAVIDANLAPEEFDQRTGSAWLAFWGQVPHVPTLRRVQSSYQRRSLSLLRAALRRLVPDQDARMLAGMIAAMIDGVWLRAALSGWREADSESARAMLTAFVEGRLAGAGMAAREPAAPGNAVTRFAALDPASGETLGSFDVAGPAEVNDAVRTALRGQVRWAAMTGVERARVLRQAATLLRARNRELAELETRDTGRPIRDTAVVDVACGADCFEHFAGVAQTSSGEHVDFGAAAFAYTRREPLGVVAAIGAWNSPLQTACRTTAAALACGNAMVFKPAEQTPCTAVKLKEILLQAGVPPGVFQVMQGFAETGRLLTSHPDIRTVSLNGGGKSPLIVFDDVHLDQAVAGALFLSFRRSGQGFANGVRLFVHRAVKAEFLARLVVRVAALRIGDPLHPDTEVGALISEAHLQRVLGYIAKGREEGAHLLIGGERVCRDGLDRGCFLAPAVFDDCRDDMQIVREKVFGPFMSVLEFTHEDEVIERANAAEFAPAAGVFSNDLSRARRVVERLHAGACWINPRNVTSIELPFACVTMPGPERDNWRAALGHYSQLKRVYVAMSNVEAIN